MIQALKSNCISIQIYNTITITAHNLPSNGFIYLLLFTIVSIVSGFLLFPSYSKTIIKSIRYLRSINYTAGVLFGFSIGYALKKQYTPFLFGNLRDYCALFSLVMSIFFSFCGAVVVNDIFDVTTDAVSRHRNPLIKNTIKKSHYLLTGLFFYTLAFSYALNAGFTAFLIILISMALSFLYSSPPFRLKRFPIISTFMLALSTLCSIILGFSLFAGGKALFAFPSNLTFLFLVSLTCGFTPKDLVDVKGDKLSRIFTIPVIFGEKIGKIITYVLVCFGYLFIPFILRSNFLLTVSIVFSVLTGFVFLLRRIHESLFLITYYLFSSVVIIFLFFNPEVIN